MDDKKFEEILKEKLSQKVDTDFDKNFWARLEHEKFQEEAMLRAATRVLKSFWEKNIKVIVPSLVTCCLLIVIGVNNYNNYKNEELFLVNNQEVLENLDLLIVMEENDLTDEELDILLEGLEDEVST